MVKINNMEDKFGCNTNCEDNSTFAVSSYNDVPTCPKCGSNKYHFDKDSDMLICDDCGTKYKFNK